MSAARRLLGGSAAALVAALRARDVGVRTLVEASLYRIGEQAGGVDAFAGVTAERALRRAAELDRELADRNGGAATLPLLGVPFAVQDRFDVAGLARAGVKAERGKPPAVRDAPLIARLEDAGAILLGTVGTPESAPDAPALTTGAPAPAPSANDAAPARAVATGRVPLALGCDTSGSLRIAASLCGTFGLKPTYGRLPRHGSYPFAPSFDHLGVVARSAHDLALAYDAMQGHDSRDPACASRPTEPALPGLTLRVDALRVAVLGGYFDDQAGAEARTAVSRVADALDTRDDVTLPQVGRAHAAANLIAAVESAALHFGALRSRAADFEPSMRDLLLAGALLPAAWSQQAQRLRRWFALRAAELFREVDVLIAPATPDPARPADAGRPGLALLTQPFSFIGLPVCVVPVWGCHATLPMGVQIVAAPWREDLVLRIAHHLQLAGVAHAPVLMPGETHAGAMRLEPVDSRF